MRVYFSGGVGKLSAEFLIPQHKPHVMLTFIEVIKCPGWSGAAEDRLKQHVLRKTGADPKTKVNKARRRAAVKSNVLPNTVLKHDSKKAQYGFGL